MKRLPSVSTICERVCRFLRDEILDEHVEVTPNSPLTALGLDSVSLVSLVLHVEREFGVPVPDAALTPENLKSVETLAQCLHGLNGQSCG